MRPASSVWPLVACWACTLELVDVGEAAPEQTTMQVLIETSEPDAGLAVFGRLVPGRVSGEGQRTVTHPHLKVSDRSLAPDSSLQEGRLVLAWQTSAPFPAGARPTVTLGLPDVDGLPTPVLPAIELDRPAGWVGAPDPWQPGTDLRLLHSLGSEAGGEAWEPSWSIRIRVVTDGISHAVFSTIHATPVPDTVVVPGAWMAGLGAGDSLQVEVARDRSVEPPAPAPGYAAIATMRERLRWVVPILDQPDPLR